MKSYVASSSAASFPGLRSPRVSFVYSASAESLDIQLGKHLLCGVSIVYRFLLRLYTRRDRTQPDHAQCAAQSPTLGDVFLDIHELCPELLASITQALDDLLDCVFVHKVIQTQLVWILELKLVIVCQETKECEGFEQFRDRVGILYQLAGRRSGQRTQKLRWVRAAVRTFMTEGNISRCIKYVRRLVWYAPDVTASATSMAFCRISTRQRPSAAGSS